MKFGVTVFLTDRSIDPVELAVASEQRGFDSVWLPEHTHIPVSRHTPWPMNPERELPDSYKRTLDPLIALAAMSSVTSTLRLGTGILLPAQREPIVTAKAIASLDHLSGGRVSVGVGFGWNRDEIENHGVEFARRRDISRAHTLAMRALWDDEIAEYHGDGVDIAPSWSWPKPVQSPLPILVGGAAGPKMFAHLVEYADGWIPIGGTGLAESIPVLHAQLEAAGRDPSTFEIVPFGSAPDTAKLEHFASIGVTGCVFNLPDPSRDGVLRSLDEFAALTA